MDNICAPKARMFLPSTKYTGAVLCMHTTAFRTSTALINQCLPPTRSMATVYAYIKISKLAKITGSLPRLNNWPLASKCQAHA